MLSLRNRPMRPPTATRPLNSNRIAAQCGMLSTAGSLFARMLAFSLHEPPELSADQERGAGRADRPHTGAANAVDDVRAQLADAVGLRGQEAVVRDAHPLQLEPFDHVVVSHRPFPLAK